MSLEGEFAGFCGMEAVLRAIRKVCGIGEVRDTKQVILEL